MLDCAIAFGSWEEPFGNSPLRNILRLGLESWRRLSRALRIAVVVIIFGMVLIAALEAATIGLVFPLISMISDGNAPQALVIALEAASIELPSVQNLALLLIIVFVGKNALVAITTFAQARFLGQVTRDFGDRALKTHILTPFEKHLKRSDADMTASIVGRLYTVIVFFYEPLFIVASEIMVATGIVAVLVIIEPFYSLIVLVSFGILGGIGNLTLRRFAQKSGNKKEVEHQKLLHLYSQTLRAIAEIHTSNRPSFFLGLIGQHLNRYADSIASERFIVYMPRAFIETAVGILLFGGLAWVVGSRFAGSELIGLVALLAAAAVRLMPSASRILYALTTINLARDAFTRLLPDIDQTTSLPKPKPGFPPYRLEREIEIRNVSYRYPGVFRNAVNDVTIWVGRGERVGIIGQSGSGKTTLLRMLVGLLQPSTGAIFVDGREIMNELSEWREIVAYVPQNPMLIDDTVRANIVFGWDEGDIERLRRVLRYSQLDAVVAELPAGVETLVGGTDHNLSQGQQQLIAIARALYREPQILVMDEPTASLDPETETEITNVLNNLDPNLTMIIVGHRGSLVRQCERILAFEGGILVSDKKQAWPPLSDPKVVELQKR